MLNVVRLPRRLATILAVIGAVLILTACGSSSDETPADQVAQQPTETSVPANATLAPSETPVLPTDTPEPTATPEPTDTLEPTETSEPTATATPKPPTSTPAPTETPTPVPPTATSTIAASATPVSTNTPAPTATPEPAAQTSGKSYDAPVLVSPNDRYRFDFNSEQTVILDWEWDGELQANEYFDVRVWQKDQPHYGIAWTKTTQHELRPVGFDKGQYFWTVAVIRGEDGQWIEDLSAEAPQRELGFDECWDWGQFGEHC